jgi:putative transposase
MAREARRVVPGYPHHIYLRGNNRRRLFSNDSDRLLWLLDLRRGIEASSCLLHQHTIMDNHVHMIVTPPAEDSMAKLIKRTCQRYAQQRNEAREASGKLFEERYQSKVIETERQFVATTLYNDANAFRAGMVSDPLEHEWSTGPLHAGRNGSRIGAWLWTPGSWYLRLARTPNARAVAYQILMENYAPMDNPPAIFEEPDDDEEDHPYHHRVERPDRSSAR